MAVARNKWVAMTVCVCVCVCVRACVRARARACLTSNCSCITRSPTVCYKLTVHLWWYHAWHDMTWHDKNASIARYLTKRPRCLLSSCGGCSSTKQRPGTWELQRATRDLLWSCTDLPAFVVVRDVWVTVQWLCPIPLYMSVHKWLVFNDVYNYITMLLCFLSILWLQLCPMASTLILVY